MFDSFFTFIHDLFQTNAFFSGGAILGLIGGLAAWGRKLPGQLWDWFLRRIFIEFEITQRDEAFWVFDEWLAQHPYSLRYARWLSLRTKRTAAAPGEEDNNSLPTILLSPAPGTHWLWWKRFFIIVHRDRKEPSGGGGGTWDGPSFNATAHETFRVSVLTRRREVVRNLIEEAYRITRPPKHDPRMTIFLPDYEGWDGSNKRRLRSLESVIWPEGLMEDLLARVKNFKERATWYNSLGIPHRLGVMLHGLPRNGKTSGIIALASELKMDLAILNLNLTWMTDERLLDLLMNVPPNTIILVEDMDCIFHQREGTKDKDNRITFSGLLNALDGVLSSEGRILFGTTNHIDRLDPALKGDGRFDIRIEIKNASKAQAKRLFQRFFPAYEQHALTFMNQIKEEQYSMAALQNHLLRHKDDAVSAALERIAHE